MVPTKILVHAIVTEPGFVTKAAVEAMLTSANAVYSSIQITYELASFEVDSDPALKKDKGPSVATSGEPLNLEMAREARAVRYPGRLVIIFRPRLNSTEYKSYAYGSSTADYLVMGGAGAMDFAHEVGHFLHLHHTHSDTVMNQLYAANKDSGYAAAKGLAISLIKDSGGLDVFDGDRGEVKDTPPDPGPPLFQPSGYTASGAAVNPTEHCSGTLSLIVEGTTYVLAPDRANIMSYYKGCAGTHNLSPDQRKIIDAAVTSGNRRHLGLGATPEGPAAITTTGGHLHVFARGDDRNIWHSYFNGSAWNGWRADLGPGTLSSGPAAVATAGGSHIHVFARGDDRNIWHSFWNGSVWSGWRDDLGKGTLTSGPAVVQAGASGSHLHVFARGDDRNIWHSFWNGSLWSGWHADLGKGTLSSGPAAVATAGGSHVHVFARGDDRNIWHSFWNGSVWSGWRDDLGKGTLTSGPAAVLTGADLHVFARGDDRGVWHSYWNGSVWSGWRSNVASGTFMSGPGVVATASAIHSFAQGDDRKLWHSVWDGQHWSFWTPDLGGGTFQI
jgi:hypothetical protein